MDDSIHVQVQVVELRVVRGDLLLNLPLDEQLLVRGAEIITQEVYLVAILLAVGFFAVLLVKVLQFILGQGIYHYFRVPF
jgi:hypothetical protein